MEKQWNIIRKVFPIEGCKFEPNKVSNGEVDNAVEIMQKHGVSRLIVNLCLEHIWTYIRKSVSPSFWHHFYKYAELDASERSQGSTKAVSILYTAVCEIEASVAQIMVYLERCSRAVNAGNITICDQISPSLDLYSHLKVRLAAALLSQLPPCFPVLVEDAFQKVFGVFTHESGIVLQEQDESSNDLGLSDMEYADNNETDSCSVIALFKEINRRLRKLDLLERLCGTTISDIVTKAIDEKVEKACQDSYCHKWIDPLEKWLQKIVTGWLALVYGEEGNEGMSEEQLGTVYKPALYSKYTSTRIGQLFNIVIEYPESQPVLEDLRDCLEKTRLRDCLVTSLKEGIQTRMLHPGVNTLDILNAYISTIKALRILDPEGILLELISDPIRQYLRGRSDFVRYIVTSLTDDGGSELSDELLVSAPLVLDDSYSEADDMENWQQWMPDPMHAQTSAKRKSQRTADIISMLVNIYGSRNVFIIEYQTILADRILTHFNYDTEQEIRYLEHLKVRFGDNLAQLHKCEVMVKDVGDSKRINTSIQSAQNPHFKKHSFPVSCLIVSSQFWPLFKEDTLKVPDAVLTEFGIYTDAYQDLKGNRTLVWKPHLGQVHLVVSFSNQTLDLMVSPVEATIILNFQNKSRWSLEELSREMQVPKAALRRKIAFWQAQGVLKEVSTDVFSLCEEDGSEGPGESSKNEPSTSSQTAILPVREILEEESESVMASPHEEEMQVIWSYIVGMLGNLGSLPLDRIHSNLKLFVQDAVACNRDQVRALLDEKIREHLISYSNGLYKLSKN